MTEDLSPGTATLNRIRVLATSIRKAAEELAFCSLLIEYRTIDPLHPVGGLKEKTRLFEIFLISEALKATDGNQVHAARLLGVKPSTLHGKIKAYKIIYKGSTDK